MQRTFSSKATRCFRSIVIGTGPCGILTAGLFAEKHGKDMLWIGDSDIHELGGRFNRYLAVPGNTPVTSFKEAFAMVPLLSDDAVIQNLTPDEDGTCPLGHVFPVLSSFSRRIAQTCTTSFSTRVTSLHLNSDDKLWTVKTNSNHSFCGSSVIFIPGAIPRPQPTTNHSYVDVLDAVQPQHGVLTTLASSNATVSVVGNSHTAMLIVKNLIEADVPKIRVYQKSPLKHAEHRPGGWVKYDGTGLKGSVSDWVKSYHFRGVEFVNVPVDENTEDLIDESDAVIWATGFVRENMPDLMIDGVLMGGMYSEYDGYSGEIAPGLFGGGIGFPERWTDPQDHSEYRVGFNPPFVAHMARILGKC